MRKSRWFNFLTRISRRVLSSCSLVALEAVRMVRSCINEGWDTKALIPDINLNILQVTVYFIFPRIEAYAPNMRSMFAFLV
ncbi:hypothetical protein B0H19DRAFT_14535 [Mycena capillaripes]|nr:hypothetical protein B0H19DRAFT_14535 [Mycena capillaripes]